MAGENERTFGSAIAAKRKELGLSQKQLADRIKREEGGPISPQYLNDIEHDRRSPSSDHMIQEFARELKMSPNFLYYLVGRVPADVRQLPLTPRQVDRLVTAFRRSVPTRKAS